MGNRQSHDNGKNGDKTEFWSKLNISPFSNLPLFLGGGGGGGGQIDKFYTQNLSLVQNTSQINHRNVALSPVFGSPAHPRNRDSWNQLPKKVQVPIPMGIDAMVLGVLVRTDEWINGRTTEQREVWGGCPT